MNDSFICCLLALVVICITRHIRTRSFISNLLLLSMTTILKGLSSALLYPLQEILNDSFLNPAVVII